MSKRGIKAVRSRTKRRDRRKAFLRQTLLKRETYRWVLWDEYGSEANVLWFVLTLEYLNDVLTGATHEIHGESLFSEPCSCVACAIEQQFGRSIGTEQFIPHTHD